MGGSEASAASASTRKVVLSCLLTNPEFHQETTAVAAADWSEQSSVARLVNAMASMGRGRNYLGNLKAC